MKTATIIFIAYLFGAALSIPINAGMWFADLKHDYGNDLGPHDQRRELGEAVAGGCLAAVVWPATVPMIFCMTGFAQDGWTLTPDPIK